MKLSSKYIKSQFIIVGMAVFLPLTVASALPLFLTVKNNLPYSITLDKSEISSDASGSNVCGGTNLPITLKSGSDLKDHFRFGNCEPLSSSDSCGSTSNWHVPVIKTNSGVSLGVIYLAAHQDGEQWSVTFKPNADYPKIFSKQASSTKPTGTWENCSYTALTLTIHEQ